MTCTLTRHCCLNEIIFYFYFICVLTHLHVLGFPLFKVFRVWVQRWKKGFSTVALQPEGKRQKPPCQTNLGIVYRVIYIWKLQGFLLQLNNTQDYGRNMNSSFYPRNIWCLFQKLSAFFSSLKDHEK